ncbi:DUF853 family protein [Crenobacter intestini]|uniref:DUF853 family protein n=1 Tax=Crenobacter intestini TaxID=2563443 RepID=A0A4V4N951_9NEIS|nr:helicase HerA-like domain-containing protein [Crenobacter intestini]TIC87003.1 DUF853 family protein [Crenobacter intestini]
MSIPPLRIARASATDLELLPALANRHGLITGATGTGKTVTLMRMAEAFSRIGTPVFVSDVKGDLAGLGAAGEAGVKLAERCEKLGMPLPEMAACPVVCWDVFGELGHPLRATVSDMGPLLLARLMGLNDLQRDLLQMVFRIADDNGLLLLDLKDLRAMLAHVAEHAKDYAARYGNANAASVGAIQRALLALEEEGGDAFFGEPMLDIRDLMRRDAAGHGVVNVLAAERLIRSPRVYATFLLWLLAELYETLPEIGDADAPVLVFFFDEAHLLFDDAPPALIDKVELIVRLVRSKGVGVYFVSQNPLDIPETVLGQLGNRVQHALRAYSPRDQKAVRVAAQTLRANPAFDAEQVIAELAVGEALVSFLQADGAPSVVERAWVYPPGCRLGPLSSDERAALARASGMASRYDTPLDRESAYEKLAAGYAADASGTPNGATAQTPEAGGEGGGLAATLSGILFGSRGPRGGRHEGVLESAAKSVARAAGSSVGRELVRGILGSLLGRRR